MARPGGNPDFGTKYRFYFGREHPLTEQVKVLMDSDMKNQLKRLAKEENCSIPEIVRTAIKEYVAKQIEQSQEYCEVK
ncbi:MAG: ribbon-helix-helix protein, CopG family [Microcystaceae cyanobacterium]